MDVPKTPSEPKAMSDDLKTCGGEGKANRPRTVNMLTALSLCVAAAATGAGIMGGCFTDGATPGLLLPAHGTCGHQLMADVELADVDAQAMSRLARMSHLQSMAGALLGDSWSTVFKAEESEGEVQARLASHIGAVLPNECLDCTA